MDKADIFLKLHMIILIARVFALHREYNIEAF